MRPGTIWRPRHVRSGDETPSVTTSLPPSRPPDDEVDSDREDERLGPAGFRSLDRWEVAAYLFWVIASLALIAGWVWWQRAKEAGIL
ncbi:MAG: hypothetical protein AVDCRST_MAG77-1641 [uncultured Chloroflexi bacterium]|uniref:Uncharacterized protein n=1 Tax=uncultured Chloroflexota bacterium TaxID=166587 RepID=A0A6J4I1Y4_9CHLR|nr:MAG: hypothetical protein AVDCRST_MAG77-1641 [uncultured Chloroflexota bacterium]